MKRLLVLATVAFAFSATSAMAMPFPHNDDDPDNWGKVSNLALCGSQPCVIDTTSTDPVVTATMDGEPYPGAPCHSVTVTWQLLLAGSGTLGQSDAQGNGNCFWVVSWNQPISACVYSPSGFTSGSADIELWLRDQVFSVGLGEPIYASASGGPVGNHVYRFDGYEYDQQTTTIGNVILTVSATHSVDGDPVLVEHDRGATPCGFPELS